MCEFEAAASQSLSGPDVARLHSGPANCIGYLDQPEGDLDGQPVTTERRMNTGTGVSFAPMRNAVAEAQVDEVPWIGWLCQRACSRPTS